MCPQRERRRKQGSWERTECGREEKGVAPELALLPPHITFLTVTISRSNFRHHFSYFSKKFFVSKRNRSTLINWKCRIVRRTCCKWLTNKNESIFQVRREKLFSHLIIRQFTPILKMHIFVPNYICIESLSFYLVHYTNVFIKKGKK